MTMKIDQSDDPRLRLNLRQLEVFVATVRGGSTRAAAQRIARSQSPASSALAELESSLGVALFDRVGRRLLLNAMKTRPPRQPVACLSRRAAAEELALGKLVELRTRLPPPTRRLAIVLHRDKRLGRGAEEFLACCSEVQTGKSVLSAAPAR